MTDLHLGDDFDSALDACTPTAQECPRCGSTVEQRFAGPCNPCREDLRQQYSSTPKGDGPVDTAFEPKMNVVPNQVATKD